MIFDKKWRRFMALYDPQARRAMHLAMAGTSVLGLADLLSLVAIYPVLAQVAGTKAPSNPFRDWGVSNSILVFLAIALLAFRTVGGFFVRYWWGRQAAAAEVRLGSRMMRTYAYAPFEFHLAANSAELMGRAISNVNMVSTTTLLGAVTLVGDATGAMAMAAGLFVADFRSATVISAVLVLVGVCIVKFSRGFVAHHAQHVGQLVGQTFQRSAALLGGIRELTVADGREAALLAVEETRAGMALAQRNLLTLQEVPRLVLELLMYVGVLVALVAAMTSNDMSTVLPLVGLYLFAALRILPGVSRLLGTWSQIRAGMEIGLDIEDELALAGRSADHFRPAAPLPHRGTLAVDGVDFAYAGAVPVLRDVNFELPAGDSLAIVGPSGSGKSTLLGVLMGLLSPTAGSITFGGADVGVGDSAWMCRIGYVPQDVFVLDDTVLANVALGDDKPNDEKAMSALRRAHLGEVIDALPDGLLTRLHEQGARLSGGQRQRLGIARALYRDATLLLLDEPTAALDGSTEAHIVRTIEELHGSVSVVVVAHRLSTIRHVDQVYELTPVTGNDA